MEALSFANPDGSTFYTKCRPVSKNLKAMTTIQWHGGPSE